MSSGDEEFLKSNDEWRTLLTPEQFYVTREKGTERAFTGEYWDCKKPGIYRCVCCKTPLFSSHAKYRSATGWPSFSQPIADDVLGTKIENRPQRSVTEVYCVRCEAHLGHVFDDGPQPTGLRFCINSVALEFESRIPD